MIVCKEKVSTVKEDKMSSTVEALLADGDRAVDNLAAVVQQVKRLRMQPMLGAEGV